MALKTALPQIQMPMEQIIRPESGLSRVDIEKLHDLQMMDRLRENEDEDSKRWDVMEVLEHRVSTLKRRTATNEISRGKHLRVKVKYRSTETRWVQAEAVKLQDPFPLIQYASRKGLIRNAAFAWVKQHTEDADRLITLVNAFKTKVSYGPKYKFGIQVASNPYHAALLDKANGNTLWQEAIAKELEQINAYNTFRELENH
jgi:hypothetical protein